MRQISGLFPVDKEERSQREYGSQEENKGKSWPFVLGVVAQFETKSPKSVMNSFVVTWNIVRHNDCVSADGRFTNRTYVRPRPEGVGYREKRRTHREK